MYRRKKIILCLWLKIPTRVTLSRLISNDLDLTAITTTDNNIAIIAITAILASLLSNIFIFLEEGSNSSADLNIL